MEKRLHSIDKSEWLEGPWSHEPDLVFYEDRATKLPCLIERHEMIGNLNGYIGVRQKHPIFQVDYGKIVHRLDIDRDLIPPIVFSGFRPESLQRVDYGEDGHKIWWFGFDNYHPDRGDVAPMDAILATAKGTNRLLGYYKNVEYVTKQLAHLAASLSRFAIQERKTIRR